jgi:hypothetical protein
MATYDNINAHVVKEQSRKIAKNLKDIFMEKTEFEEGDYIVVIKAPSSSFKTNMVFKQRENHRWIRTYRDSNGHTNGNSDLTFDRNTDWRYATPEEIATYDKADKPIDVTKINKIVTIYEIC